MDLDNILHKMRRYCAYRERSHKEVRSKLLDLKVYGMNLERVMSQLIEEDFLNELRYAKSYASGKFRMNKWGRVKILQGLKGHSISQYCVNKAMKEIDDQEYFKVLTQLLIKKKRQYNVKDDFTLNQKLIKYALGRGFTYDEIKDAFQQITS